MGLQHENWKQHRSSYQKKINAKSNLILSAKYIYPFIRFFANCINLVSIITRYTHWYEANENNTHWNKYCAFIIALLYMPIFKGRATMRWFGFPIWHPGPPSLNANDATDSWTSWILSIFCTMFIEWAFVIIFMIVSAPIFISGIFIYLTTTLLFMIWMTCSFVLVFVVFMNKSEDIGGYSGMVISSTIGMLFVLNVITICTMEFYGGNKWTESYRIGIRGEYCDESDYFSFDKWNEYEWDIRFL